ncbi:hypothetical protein FHR71_001149 [Methylobacterium sp. RAS18]|nr:hypothetical protein [Methylobacterium sp. RAS18]
MSASPFGFAPSVFGGPSDEDLARALALSAARMPAGFSGAPSSGLPQMPEQAMSVRPFGFGQIPAPSGDAMESPAPAQASGPAPAAEPVRQAVPQRAGLADVASPARPGAMTVPLPPARPAEFSTAEADLPAAGAQPIMAAPQPGPAQAPAATAEGPSFGDTLRKGLRDNGDYFGALGAGLLSSPTWAGGVSAAMQLASKNERDRAVTDLAKAEHGLKQRKLAQETGALSGNASFLKKVYPGLSDQEAVAMASNTTALSEALKISRDPNHGRDNDPTVIRAKAQAQAEGAAAGKPDETYVQMPEAERVSLGLPAGAYQRDSRGKVSPVNPTGTTINNMGAEKAQDATVGKGYGDYQLDLATKGRNAGSTLNTLALMEQAMNTPGFYSGVGGEGVKRANQFLGALGVKDSRAASAAEVFDALSNKVVLDGLGGSLGPGISNTDRDYISRTAPTLAQSEQGNRDLIGVARKLAQRQQDVSKLAREYAGNNNGRLDAGFDQVLDEYATANPLFPQARDSASASAPKEPPQGAPAGSRQAADGMWYVPDPNRPGKYLKVQ